METKGTFQNERAEVDGSEDLDGEFCGWGRRWMENGC